MGHEEVPLDAGIREGAGEKHPNGQICVRQVVELLAGQARIQLQGGAVPRFFNEDILHVRLAF
eukprot:5788918-Pyramimonas_sp.AAC.2